MMRNASCRELGPQLSSFVDGELRSSERTVVEEHLASCSSCAGQVSDLRAQSSLVRLAMEMQTDEVDWRAFTKEVMARVGPARVPWAERLNVAVRELFTYRRGAMMGVAAAAAALIVSLPLWMSRTASDGYAGERMALHSVSTNPAAHVAPVVMAGERGDAIVWLVSHRHVLEGEPEADVGEEQPNDEAGAPVKMNQERKHGGEL